MERDFTTKAYNDFCKLVDQADDKKWNNITDWFGDGFLRLKHRLADWGLLHYTDLMNTYYKELLDRENTSKDLISQVFEGVSDLDTTFSNVGPDHFGYCRNYLKDLRECLGRMSILTTNASGPESFVGFGGFSPTRIADFTSVALLKLQYYAMPAPERRVTPSTFSDISNEEKEAFISRCESICPDLAQAVDLLFTDPDWTGQEKLDVKFMLYSAPEPYRFLFFDNSLFRKTVMFQQGSEDSDGYDNSCFSPLTGTVYLEDLDSNLRDNPLAPYDTVFHEHGHVIDFVKKRAGTALSENFWVDGDNLHTCIVNDVRNYVNQQFDRMCGKDYRDLTPEQKQLLLDKKNREALLASLNLPGDQSNTEFEFIYGGSHKALPDELKTLRNLFQRDVAYALREEVDIAASDVYGGVTNNAIPASAGHRGEKYKFYWYDENGTMTKAQTRELWAEFYAAQMTGDEEALASMNEHFPTAYPMLEQMASQMAAQ